LNGQKQAHAPEALVLAGACHEEDPDEKTSNRNPFSSIYRHLATLAWIVMGSGKAEYCPGFYGQFRMG
jgi:hypothetical protein